MKNIKKLLIIIPILTLTTFFTSVKAEIKVVASIKPIHSLATYLMEGVAKPKLIVDGYASPHGFALKPSHAKMLQEADLIFWVGEDLESFLEKPLNTIAKKAENIELMEIKGLNKLKFRERNIFDGHDDHDHGHKEDKHKEDDHDDHDHKKKDGHKEDDHDDHDHKKKTVTKRMTMIPAISKKMLMMTMTTTDIRKRTITMIMKVIITANMTPIFG